MPTRRKVLSSATTLASSLAVGGLAGCATGGQGGSGGTPDVILFNGQITTLDKSKPVASAVADQGRQISGRRHG